MLAGAKEAVAPAGSPVTLDATLPLNPLIGAVAMAAVVCRPGRDRAGRGSGREPEISGRGRGRERARPAA